LTKVVTKFEQIS